MNKLPSTLRLYNTIVLVRIGSVMYDYEFYIMQEDEPTSYIVNWKTGKCVRVFDDWDKYQKTINKNINNLNALLDLYNGDNDCVRLANIILGVDIYFYSMRNIIAALI